MKISKSSMCAIGAVALSASPVGAFAPSSTRSGGVSTTTTPKTTTELAFGIPSFLDPTKKDDDDSSSSSSSDLEKPEKKIGLSGVIQLITAGAGAPFLGDFEGVDKETGKFMFSLEANNLVDEEGKSKQTQMPHFENGWVDPEDEKRAAEGFKFPWQK